MAKRGGCLTQLFRQMPNPPIVALVVVVPLRILGVDDASVWVDLH
jgi:hypothetical protein